MKHIIMSLCSLRVKPLKHFVLFQERVPSVHIDDEMDAQEEMASEEVTEETKTFQITGVTDGATGQMISFEEALKKVRIDSWSLFFHTRPAICQYELAKWTWNSFVQFATISSLRVCLHWPISKHRPRLMPMPMELG